MRRIATAALAGLMTASMAATAFAATGWQQDESGNYRYYITNSTYLTSGYTDDGYYVDVNGIWDGNASIGLKQQDGSYEIVVTPLDEVGIIGERILKSKGNPTLDENNIYHVLVDVYDTGFLSAAALRQVNAGDVLEIPGFEKVLTALTKGKPSKIVVANEEKGKQASSSGYRITLTDAEGNNYVMTSNRLRKTSPDGSTTETMFRKVAEDVEIEIPSFMGVERASGVTQAHTMAYLLNNALMFKADMRGTRVTRMTDVPYNYDTTTAQEYDEDAAHGKLNIERE